MLILAISYKCLPVAKGSPELSRLPAGSFQRRLCERVGFVFVFVCVCVRVCHAHGFPLGVRRRRRRHQSRWLCPWRCRRPRIAGVVLVRCRVAKDGWRHRGVHGTITTTTGSVAASVQPRRGRELQLHPVLHFLSLQQFPGRNVRRCRCARCLGNNGLWLWLLQPPFVLL